MKTYVLMLSRNFPAKHPRKGEQTNFNYQILNAVWRERNMSIGFPQYGMKLHTIRGNYELWSKRFEQIEAGKACISLRYWIGKPYHSKQIEIVHLTKEDGIGIQKLEYNFKECILHIGNLLLDPEILAINDGLTRKEWEDWFSGYDFTKPLAIIHFTKFRY